MIDVHLSFFLQNVIGRCSQPLVGPNGRRSREDEKLMTAFNVKIPGIYWLWPFKFESIKVD